MNRIWNIGKKTAQIVDCCDYCPENKECMFAGFSGIVPDDCPLPTGECDNTLSAEEQLEIFFKQMGYKIVKSKNKSKTK